MVIDGFAFGVFLRFALSLSLHTGSGSGQSLLKGLQYVPIQGTLLIYFLIFLLGKVLGLR